MIVKRGAFFLRHASSNTSSKSQFTARIKHRLWNTWKPFKFSSIRHAPESKLLRFSFCFVLSKINYFNCSLAGLPLHLIHKLQKVGCPTHCLSSQIWIRHHTSECPSLAAHRDKHLICLLQIPYWLAFRLFFWWLVYAFAPNPGLAFCPLLPQLQTKLYRTWRTFCCWQFL